MENKRDLVGKELPAADGTDAGARVLSYDSESDDYYVRPIKWSTGETKGSLVFDIDAFKITYRYCPDQAREPKASR